MAFKVKGRDSIRRDARGNSIPSSIELEETKNLNVSQEELSQNCDSDNENRSESNEEFEIKQSPLSKIKTQLNSSPKASPNKTDSFVPESALPESSSRTNHTKYVSFGIGAIVLFIGVLWYRQYNMVNPEKEEEKACSFDNLKKNYQQENDFLWKTLEYGIEDILNNKSQKPAVFLFVHNGTSKANQLIDNIAKNSASCFGSPTNIKKLDFTSKEAKEDHGNIVAQYKREIKEGNVILIVHLNEIPAAAAKAFHSICDTHSPIVNKVVIILSLSAKRESNDEKVIYTAENALKRLWESGMKDFELDPIITRVTDQVLLLQTN